MLLQHLQWSADPLRGLNAGRIDGEKHANKFVIRMAYGYTESHLKKITGNPSAHGYSVSCHITRAVFR